MAEIALSPIEGVPVVNDDGTPTLEFQRLLEIVVTNSNNSPPLTGVGAPETIVQGRQGQWYVDTSGIPAAVYYKQFGDGDTGWIITS